MKTIVAHVKVGTLSVVHFTLKLCTNEHPGLVTLLSPAYS